MCPLVYDSVPIRKLRAICQRMKGAVKPLYTIFLFWQQQRVLGQIKKSLQVN